MTTEFITKKTCNGCGMTVTDPPDSRDGWHQITVEDEQESPDWTRDQFRLDFCPVCYPTFQRAVSANVAVIPPNRKPRDLWARKEQS